MLEYVEEVVSTIEADPAVATRQQAIRGLRQLGLDDFGEVLLAMPDPRFPKLSRLLPAMADETTQRNWTGNCGLPLLKQTAVFVRTMSYSYSRLTGRALDSATVLDYGCGYGRIARLMYYFTDEHCVHGVDPWDESIRLCRECGLTTNFEVSDYLPVKLPVGEARFDLIYAFSVFTHLSQRATLTALNALRRYIKPQGILVITVRPIEYWGHDPHTDDAERSALKRLHNEVGFAFKPHNRSAVDGDITYGDTSMTLEWLERNASDWSLALADRSLEDPFQRYLVLKPTDR